MSYQQEIYQLVSQFAGQANTIAVPRVFCKFVGSLEGGTLLSQMLYWCDRGSDPEGWFYKSYIEWEDETFLSEYQVRKLVKQFEALGFLETKLKKANGSPTLHYRINKGKFSESILKFFRNGDTENLKNPILKNEESITKTTTQTTTKSKSISCAAPQTPASFPSKKKEKEKKPEHPNTKAIFDAYCAVVSEAEPGCKILYPATRVCAQELAAAGWEPEQVTKAFWLMKKDAFWKAKHLTLMSVQKQIAALLKGKSNASVSEFKDPSIYGGEIQFTTEIDLDTLSFNF